jgi:hypothetical protein
MPFVDLSRMAASTSDNINAIKCNNSTLPIVWIYNEPLSDIEDILGITKVELLTDNDWESQREKCNQYCLEQISNLGRPVLLIGGPSDVKDCNFPNIRVSCDSWQKFIAEKAGLSVVNGVISGTYDSGTAFQVSDCWAAEMMHRTMFEHPDVQPVHSLVESIWNTFFFWKEIERLGWFFGVHPNKQATEAFADLLRPDIIKFLEDTK